jgi:hypothetical protein
MATISARIVLAAILTASIASPSVRFVANSADSASLLVIPPQYHVGAGVVSPRQFAVIPRRIEGYIALPPAPGPTLFHQLDTALNSVPILPAEVAGAQYQRVSDASDRRLLLRVGLGLGAAYLVFLGAWIWATRLRSRRPGH